MLSVQAQAKGVTLATSLHPDVPRGLVGDSLRLGQVLTNLAGNALKFTDEGQVNIEITLVERDLDGDCARLRFAVRDTGVGVTPKVRMPRFNGYARQGRRAPVHLVRMTHGLDM